MTRRVVLLAVALIAGMAGGCGATPPGCDLVISGIPVDAPIPDTGAAMPNDGVRLVGPGDVDWANSSIDADEQGRPALALKLRPAAAERFGIYTRTNIGNYLPIGINGRVISVPVINSAIEDGEVRIEGGGLEALDVAPFRPCVGTGS